MSGKRHHFLPQFLSRGFASSQRGGVTNVWMYRKGRPGMELNIANVGVETHFYGKPEESDLDDRITGMETGLGPLVDELRSHPHPDTCIDDPRVPGLIAHLSLRTRQLRQSVVVALDSVFQGLRQHFSEPAVVHAMLVRQLGRSGEVRSQTERLLLESGVAPAQLESAIANLQPHILEFLEQLVPDFMTRCMVVLEHQIAELKPLIPIAMRSSFIDSMSRNLGAEQRVASYSRFTWFVIRTPVPVLLGDTACLFEINGERRFKPLNDEGDAVQRIFLPLASDRVLVGTPFTSLPRIDLRLLNKAIARCSQEFFVSSMALPMDSSLLENIGKWSGILNADQIQMMVDELKRSVLED